MQTSAQETSKRYTLSVVTPTYNRAHTLSRAWESLNRQGPLRFEWFEWIIIDDGSTDDTGKIITEWQSASRFPIIYERMPHRVFSNET